MRDKPHQNQGPALLVKLLGVQRSEVSCHTFTTLSTKKRAQHYVDFGFCREQTPHACVLLQPFSQEIDNTVMFEWARKEAKVLQQSQPVTKSAPLIGCYDSADPRALELSKCLWLTEMFCVASSKPQLANYCTDPQSF